MLDSSTLVPHPVPAPGAPVPWADPQRQAQFEQWWVAVAPRHGIDAHSLRPASADASFRRYFRADVRADVRADIHAAAGRQAGSVIVMDAPPAFENVRPFVQVAGLITAAGLLAPRVLEAELEQGFLLLSDMGQGLYLQALQQATPEQADRLMRDALQALVTWQRGVPCGDLPAFDQTLLANELALFPTWCVEREFGVRWTASEQQTWQQICALLIDSALAQPVVAVHADWMPRNLMVMPGEQGPGILDFQDAVRGPITYDLASLLRDAFISWDEERELDWAVRWWQQARREGLPLGPVMAADFGEFWRSLEWMGLQRHLKVMGIFCRLKHRDGKAPYAADLPRFFNYTLKVAMRYGPLRPLVRLIEPLSGKPLQTGYTF